MANIPIIYERILAFDFQTWYIPDGIRNINIENSWSTVFLDIKVTWQNVMHGF
jgi:hypothetical protein